MRGDVLEPLAKLRSLREFEQFRGSAAAAAARSFDDSVIEAHIKQDAWVYPGFCEPCDQHVLFGVDLNAAWQKKGRRWIPNTRERLVCPITRLNNRQRLVATVLKQSLSRIVSRPPSVYLMEQVTPFYRWCIAKFEGAKVIGSEYLGPEINSGTVIRDICHEDAACFSFETSSQDVIVSNDVFEHVAFPERSFSECARILRPGGTMLMTIPFHNESATSVTRAEIRNKQLLHHLRPNYHDNPVAPKQGSLVFTDYGWDVLEMATRAGFSDAWVGIYHAPTLGHIGSGLSIFHLLR